MQCYLVGGAVRDELLGMTVHERDWVVVGATAAEMLHLGYRQVGRDFPVFLHPQSQEEYALARTERKTAPGHLGFVVHADVDVTLEEDLRRRDLTVNALARSADGRITDPYGGQQDLQARVLRHVSPAFVEDPLRVFRVARFTSQLGAFDFVVAPQTVSLMTRMAADGELAALSAERVWAELTKALAGPVPGRFFATLQHCAALAPWFVELAAEPAPLRALEAAWRAGLGVELRFVAMLAALPPAASAALGSRLRAPREVQELGLLGARHGADLVAWAAQDDAGLLGLFERCDAFRRGARFVDLCAVVGAQRGAPLTELAALAARIARLAVVLPPDATGQEIGRYVRTQRLTALAQARAGDDAQRPD